MPSPTPAATRIATASKLPAVAVARSSYRLSSSSKTAVKLERQVQRLEEQINGYKVIDFYDDLVEEANAIQRDIDDLTNSNVLDDELARDITAAMRIEQPPAVPDLVQLFQEAGVVLQDAVVRRYAEVEEFHKAVVSNRQEHLKIELEDARARIAKRRNEIARKSERRNRILDVLNTGGALYQYRKLDGQLIDLRSEFASIQRQLELPEQIDALRVDLRFRRAEAERRIQQDVVERREVIAGASLIFDKISQQLYDLPAVFDIVAGKDGLDFKIEATEIASDGIKQVQIFTFDLMLATVCARRGAWPGFLIHDSHIFDGVDGRQIALAL